MLTYHSSIHTVAKIKCCHIKAGDTMFKLSVFCCCFFCVCFFAFVKLSFFTVVAMCELVEAIFHLC